MGGERPFTGDADSDWDESKHPRADNGQFGKGGGATKLLDGVNKFEKGFSKKNLRDHYSRHQKEYPGLSAEEYSQRALELIQKPIGGDILGFVSQKNRIVRYDKASNDFVSGDPGIGIATMMKLNGGEKRYNYLKNRDEKY